MIVSALQGPPRRGGSNFQDSQRVKRRKLDVSVATSHNPQDTTQDVCGERCALEFALEEDVESHSVPPHPLGIKPLGNSWDAQINIKSRSGAFASLPDEILLQLFESFDAPDLIGLGSTCKALYAFCRSDDLWKSLFIESSKTLRDFAWRGTWRNTFLNLPPHITSTVSCSGLFSDQLYRPFHCANLPLAPYISSIPRHNAITRLPDLTPEEYTASWADKPFILTEPVKSWPAYKEWSIEHLLRAHGDTVFRAEAVDWKFSTYVDYMRNNNDESPLYLFDCHFADKMGLNLSPAGATASSSQDPAAQPAYTPPCAFTPDLFDTLAPHRPHHRWLIIGAALSGSTFHADPNGTSAWNAVLRGSKYWLMFPPPPSTTPAIPGIHLSPDLSHITAPLSLAEYLLAFHGAARAAPACVEAVCRPGELLHVPAGWYHMVVNLEEGVALTQNFVGEAGAAGALRFLRDRREQVSGFSWGDEGLPGGGNGSGEKDEEKEEEYGEGREYELFVARLREARPAILERALAELARRDCEAAAASATSALKGRRRRLGTRWEDATMTSKNGDESGGQGFTFSFGDDGEDDDDDESGGRHDRYE